MPADHSALLALAAAAMLLMAVAAFGLAMWLENGAALFLSLAQAGLAWCF